MQRAVLAALGSIPRESRPPLTGLPAPRRKHLRRMRRRRHRRLQTPPREPGPNASPRMPSLLRQQIPALPKQTRLFPRAALPSRALLKVSSGESCGATFELCYLLSLSALFGHLRRRGTCGVSVTGHLGQRPPTGQLGGWAFGKSSGPSIIDNQAYRCGFNVTWQSSEMTTADAEGQTRDKRCR